jgi:prepilin-type N-terminal cleavage/methylation domain-containing protein
MCRPSPLSESHGFTLVEVLVASVLFVTLSLGVAQLFAVATSANAAARRQTSATILAAARLEQLRALTWSWEAGPSGTPALPRSDLTTDLSVDPPGSGGRGLRESPPGTLERNVPPYVDYLDAAGQPVGNGATAPTGAAYVRRWAVRGLPSDPDRTLVLQVLVISLADDARLAGVWMGRTGQETLLTVVRTRSGL